MKDRIELFWFCGAIVNLACYVISGILMRKPSDVFMISMWGCLIMGRLNREKD